MLIITEIIILVIQTVTFFYGGVLVLIILYKHKFKDMASIAMMVSELAHSLGQPNNHALRENLKLPSLV